MDITSEQRVLRDKAIEILARAIFFAQWNIHHDHEKCYQEKRTLFIEIATTAFDSLHGEFYVNARAQPSIELFEAGRKAMAMAGDLTRKP